METEYLKTVVHEGGRLPCYMTKHAACADLFLPERVEVEPGEVKKVPLNVSFEMARGQHVEMFPRSSLLVKRHLAMPVSVIDCDYTGIVHAVLLNVGKEKAVLEKGERVCQAKLVSSDPVVGSWDRAESERSQEGFGGTGL